MLVPEDQRDLSRKIHPVKRDGIAGKMGGENMVCPAAQVLKTRFGIGILVNRQPLSSTAAAFCSPFLMTRDPGIQDIDVLYADGVTGTHYGGNIVRVEDILQDDRQTFLSFVEHVGYPLLSLRSHKICGKCAVWKLAHFPQRANVWPSADGPPVRPDTFSNRAASHSQPVAKIGRNV